MHDPILQGFYLEQVHDEWLHIASLTLVDQGHVRRGAEVQRSKAVGRTTSSLIIFGIRTTSASMVRHNTMSHSRSRRTLFEVTRGYIPRQHVFSQRILQNGAQVARSLHSGEEDTPLRGVNPSSMGRDMRSSRTLASSAAVITPGYP